MARLGHKKSRNGCRQCKARHVKCDENKPCSSCARHGVECSLLTGPPSGPAPASVKAETDTDTGSVNSTRRARRKSKPSTPASSLPIDLVLNPSTARTAITPESSSTSPYSQDDNFTFFTKFTHKADTVQPNYWVRDLELLHHWTTDTYLTISRREDLKILWRNVAPKQGIQDHFLMHELLAIAALHLAYLRSDQRRAYLALGYHHQDLVIKSLRSMLTNIAPETAGSLFATALLVTFSVFASTGLDAKEASTNSRPVLDELFDIFALQQGMHNIISTKFSSVFSGPFVTMFSKPSVPVSPQPLLQHLYDQVPDLVIVLNTAPLSDEARTELQHGLSSFTETLEYCLSPELDYQELRFLFLWAISASQDYMNMVRRKEPPAMVFMAYYAVGLRAAEIFWFMEGWAERVIKAVSEAIDPDWQPAIQWPWDIIMSG